MTTEKFKNMVKECWDADITLQEAQTLMEKHKDDEFPIERCYATQSKYWRHIKFGEKDKKDWEALKNYGK